MTEQQPPQAPPATPPAVPTPPKAPAQPPAAPAAPPTGKQPPWGAPENFDAEKAWELIQNLRAEKQDPAVAEQLAQMQKDQAAQRDALAAALGLKPEETSDAEKLAKQFEDMRAEMVASQRRAIAVEHKIPESLLTAPDVEGMQAQAAALTEFANASHYAAVTAAPQTPPPAFQANPGQGQGGGTPSQEQLDQAEYEKYYPSKQ